MTMKRILQIVFAVALAYFIIEAVWRVYVISDYSFNLAFDIIMITGLSIVFAVLLGVHGRHMLLGMILLLIVLAVKYDYFPEQTVKVFISSVAILTISMFVAIHLTTEKKKKRLVNPPALVEIGDVEGIIRETETDIVIEPPSKRDEKKVYINFAEIQTPYHTVILGTTGSGKTQFLKTLIFRILAYAPWVRLLILDPNDDIHEDLCKYLPRKLVKVIDGSECLPKLFKVESVKDVKMYTNMVLRILKQYYPDMGGMQAGVLRHMTREALIEAMNEKKELTLLDILKYIDKLKLNPAKLQKKGYTERDVMNAKRIISEIIDDFELVGVKTLDFEDVVGKHVIVNLRSLKDATTDERNLLGLIVEMWLNFMYLHYSRKIRKKLARLVIIDEGHYVLRIEDTSLIDYARMGRKYGIAYLILTQSIFHFAKAEDVFSLAKYKIILPVSDKDLNELARYDNTLKKILRDIRNHIWKTKEESPHSYAFFIAKRKRYLIRVIKFFKFKQTEEFKEILLQIREYYKELRRKAIERLKQKKRQKQQVASRQA